MNSRIVQPAASLQPPETCTEHEECQAAQASHSELCDKALAHYEEVSAVAHHWNSLVPRAIEFYKLHGDRASVAAGEGDTLSIPDEAISEVAQCAQAVLTALNVGDVQSGSPLHLKLREVMIAYRERGVVVGPVLTEALSKIAAMHHADTCDSLLIEGYACSCHVAVALRALQNTTAAASAPTPAEPPSVPNRICDYRNKECAAYGQTVGNRWICNNHICEQLQRCWLNAKRPAPAEPLQQEGEQEKR